MGTLESAKPHEGRRRHDSESSDVWGTGGGGKGRDPLSPFPIYAWFHEISGTAASVQRVCANGWRCRGRHGRCETGRQASRSKAQTVAGDRPRPWQESSVRMLSLCWSREEAHTSSTHWYHSKRVDEAQNLLVRSHVAAMRGAFESCGRGSRRAFGWSMPSCQCKWRSGAGLLGQGTRVIRRV